MTFKRGFVALMLLVVLLNGFMLSSNALGKTYKMGKKYTFTGTYYHIKFKHTSNGQNLSAHCLILKKKIRVKGYGESGKTNEIQFFLKNNKQYKKLNWKIGKKVTIRGTLDFGATAYYYSWCVLGDAVIK